MQIDFRERHVTSTYHLLLLRQDSTLPDGLVESLRDTGCIAWQDVEWSNFPASVLVGNTAHLIVILVHRDITEALRLFKWLRDNPTPIPKLAVMCSEIASHLLSEVRTVNDDFLLSPIRKEELCER